MEKQEVLSRVKDLGLLAVIRGPSAELTVKIVKALIAGGVTGIEVTYSTPNAPWVVAELAKQYGDGILLGMGTLTLPTQAQEAKGAGASFLVSPVCTPDLVTTMLKSDLVVMAGALSPTEVFQAYMLGTDVVKIFPGSLGGPAYMKALRGPFPNIPMMPTGGVNAGNLKEWFKAGAIAVGVGSELCPKELALEGKFDEITTRAEDFVNAVRLAKSEA
ncbi:MAG: bifunctional 4-hydroxy-2-oxoglutarate aldolase/2-dehydro-3-deoxy-phosphogluconate aldolase [Anaerolineaceae bacterium]